MHLTAALALDTDHQTDITASTVRLRRTVMQRTMSTACQRSGKMRQTTAEARGMRSLAAATTGAGAAAAAAAAAADSSAGAGAAQ